LAVVPDEAEGPLLDDEDALEDAAWADTQPAATMGMIAAPIGSNARMDASFPASREPTLHGTSHAASIQRYW
jgi:hypothetical protein